MLWLLAELFYSEDFLGKLQATPGMSWCAFIPPEWTNKTEEEVWLMVNPMDGDLPSQRQSASPRQESPYNEAVTTPGADYKWDWREVRPDCLGPGNVLDVNQCYAGWAASVVSQLGITRCVNGYDKKRNFYSEQYLLSCAPVGIGCQGGSAKNAFDLIKELGVPMAACVPYTSGATTVKGECPVACADGSKLQLQGIKNVRDICKEEEPLTTWLGRGPIVTTIDVYQDFMYYDFGVFMHTEGQLLGRLDTQIIGYGKADGVEYWTCQNQWGERWGESGYFRIRKGVNECGIEKECYAMILH